MAAKQAEAKVSNEGADAPLLDLNDASVKKMIKAAKKRGFVTYDELNAVLPSDQVASEQIEDTMAMLNDMGINVVEAEEAEEADRKHLYRCCRDDHQGGCHHHQARAHRPHR
jgi:RNA polymerase primary sigma factor